MGADVAIVARNSQKTKSAVNEIREEFGVRTLGLLFDVTDEKAVQQMVEEVRRQFREIKGLMEGNAKPDTGRCVDIATRGALAQMVAPGLVAVCSPIIVGYLLGAEALGGMLAGATMSGVMMALMMANAGGAWDNAKKIVETELKAKGTPLHDASVVGDTVGDPFKDTSGPGVAILIKVMSVVSLLIAPLIATF